MYSETEGVPDVPGTLMLLIEGSRIYARRPGESPVVLDGLGLRQAVKLLRAGSAEELKRAIVYLDTDARARLQSDVAQLADEFESAEAKLAVDGLFAHLAATVAQRPGTNLLQGPYAGKANWVEHARPWRVAASLLLATGVLALVLQGAEYWSLRRGDNAMGDLPTESCQRLVGASRASACDAEVQQRLRTATSSETFLTTLEAVAAARNPAMRIDALSYRNRIMDLQLVAANVDEIDTFARALEQTRRFAPKIESANQNEGSVEGRMQIVGAQR